ncbi:uracil-DNA glycosylase family protein, partial [Spirillospora sp. NPDC047418]
MFGEGGPGGRVVLIGEQPGDQEDRKGRPFVGPAGRVLDRALEEAGIERGDVYITNAVKHFKFTTQAAASAASTRHRTRARCARATLPPPQPSVDLRRVVVIRPLITT